MNAADPALARYERQFRFLPLGEEGQRRLLAARALICGCGALGSVIANTLVRAGVGAVRIVDRDFLEWNNLQRQVLYDESDVAARLPKAIAAAAKLRAINSTVAVEPVVADVTAGNVLGLCDGVDVILDGTDNFETRFLLNDAACRLGIPWVYGGCVGAEGQCLTILPGQPPCLRCLLTDPPPPGALPTCDTAGILAPIVNIIASLQACEAIKLLAGRADAVSHTLSVIDLWDNRWRQIKLDRLREQGGCPTCRDREYPWLSGQRGSQTAVLCGRNAVQLSGCAIPESFDRLSQKLSALGRVAYNDWLLRLSVDPHEITLFADGRAIISGTDDIAAARSIHAKYLGG